MPTEAAQAVGGTLGVGNTLEFPTFAFFYKEATEAISETPVSF